MPCRARRAAAGRPAGQREQRGQHLHALVAQVVLPEPHHGVREAEPRFDVLGAPRPARAVDREAERGAHVLVLGEHPRPAGSSPAGHRSVLLGERRLVPEVPLPDGVSLAGLPQAVLGVFADRHEHAEAPGVRTGHDERAVDQPEQQVEDVVARNPVAGAHLLGGVQRPPAAEHREPPQHDPLVVGEQVVAPVEGGLERPVPGLARPGAGREQREPVVEPRRDLVEREGLHPCRRELEGQRHAVEPAADRARRRPRWTPSARRTAAPPAPARRTAAPRATRRRWSTSSAAPAAGSASGWTATCTSPGTASASRLVVSTRRSGQACSSRSANAATGLDDLLAVVQHEQRTSRSRGTRALPRQRPRQRPEACTPSWRATASATSPPGSTEARRTNRTSGAVSGTAARATSSASVVLPTPPGPVKVTSRPRRSCSSAVATSRSRPRTADSGCGSSGTRRRRGRSGALPGAAAAGLQEAAAVGVRGSGTCCRNTAWARACTSGAGSMPSSSARRSRRRR